MTSRIKGIWTNEAVKARFRELLAAKNPFSVIARTLNAEFGCALTRNAVIGKAHRLGLYNGRSRETASGHPFSPNQPRQSRAFVFKKRPLSESKLPQPYVPPAVAEDPTEYHCTIFDLTNVTCRWPLGKWNEPAKLFCGDPTADLSFNRPYCRVHARRARD